jgi:hypothetical protein
MISVHKQLSKSLICNEKGITKENTMKKLILIASLAVMATCSIASAFPNIQDYQHKVMYLEDIGTPKTYALNEILKFEDFKEESDDFIKAYSKKLDMNIWICTSNEDLMEWKCFLEKNGQEDIEISDRTYKLNSCLYFSFNEEKGRIAIFLKDDKIIGTIQSF